MNVFLSFSLSNKLTNIDGLWNKTCSLFWDEPVFSWLLKSSVVNFLKQLIAQLIGNVPTTNNYDRRQLNIVYGDQVDRSSTVCIVSQRWSMPCCLSFFENSGYHVATAALHLSTRCCHWCWCCCWSWCRVQASPAAHNDDIYWCRISWSAGYPRRHQPHSNDKCAIITRCGRTKHASAALSLASKSRFMRI